MSTTQLASTMPHLTSGRILVVDPDEDLAADLRQAAQDIGGDQVKVEICHDLTHAAKVLAHEDPFEVLVAGTSTATLSGLERLRLIHDDTPGTAVVLSFPRNHRLSLQSVVRAGALEVVYQPARAGELTGALARALRVAHRGREKRLDLAAGTSGRSTGPGTVITVASATGGCGKTFLATNLACFFARQMGRRVCILDLDLQFGEASTALRLRPRYTIADALQLQGDDQEELAEHMEEYLVQHETGPWLLAAPKDPSEADRIEPSEVGRIIEIARQHFQVVIVDTPSALTEVVLTAFDRSDILYTVATLDTPSVRNLGVFLHTLDRLKIPADNVRLVLNKAERDVGIQIDQVTRLFPQGFQSVLPYDRAVSRSINVGMPVLASSPESEISQLMEAGFTQLLTPAERDHLVTVAPETGTRRWWRWWRR